MTKLALRGGFGGHLGHWLLRVPTATVLVRFSVFGPGILVPGLLLILRRVLLLLLLLMLLLLLLLLMLIPLGLRRLGRDNSVGSGRASLTGGPPGSSAIHKGLALLLPNDVSACRHPAAQSNNN